MRPEVPFRMYCEAKWYAARTRFGQELQVKRRLAGAGVEHFIPEGAKGRPAIPCLVFLHTNKAEALDLANTSCIRMKYIIDCATRTLLVVPDKQMEDFRRVFEQADDVTSEPLALGDRVRVTHGPLKGVEGHILQFQGKTYVVVGLLNSVFAKARVPRSWLALCHSDHNTPSHSERNEGI